MEQSLPAAVLRTCVIAALTLVIVGEEYLRITNFPTPTYPHLDNTTSFNSFQSQAYTAEAATSLGVELELSFSAHNLPQRGLITKSDPMCVVFTRPYMSFEWNEYGRTEIIRGESNPKFTKKITMPYIFEERQVLRFEVHSQHNLGNEDELDDRRLIGFTECNQTELIRAGKMRLQLKRVGSSGNEHRVRRSYLVVVAEKLTSNFDEVVMELNGRELDNTDWFGVSDPYIEIYRVAEKSDGESEDVLVCKTDVVQNSLNPNWPRITVQMRKLCNGKKSRPFRFVCWDWDRFKQPDLIGEFRTTLDEIEGQQKRQFELKNPQKMKDIEYINSGIINITYFEVVSVPSFVDFIRGGLQILCSIAIDFTVSNGVPEKPDSLHYRDPGGGLNQYEKAITSVVTVLEDYDSDRLFPVYGFGAQLTNHQVYHDFHVNSKPSPHCAGVDGVLGAYRECLNAVWLAGPTFFSPVIQKVVDEVKKDEDGDNYHILTILTGGDIDDMDLTESVLVEASPLPISIIIIGIGTRDFGLMKKLDKGNETRRDIVKFVSFEEFQRQIEHDDTGSLLAKKVLAEVPEQVVSYMRSRGIEPKYTTPAALSPSTSFSDGDPLSQQLDNVSSQHDHQAVVPVNYQFPLAFERTRPLTSGHVPPPPFSAPRGSMSHSSSFQYPAPSYTPQQPFQHQGFAPQSTTSFHGHPPGYSTGSHSPYPPQYVLPSYLDPSNLPPHLDPSFIGWSNPYEYLQTPQSYIHNPNVLPSAQGDLHTTPPSQAEGSGSSQPHFNYAADTSSSNQSYPPNYHPGPPRQN